MVDSSWRATGHSSSEHIFQWRVLSLLSLRKGTSDTAETRGASSAHHQHPSYRQHSPGLEESDKTPAPAQPALPSSTHPTRRPARGAALARWAALQLRCHLTCTLLCEPQLRAHHGLPPSSAAV